MTEEATNGASWGLQELDSSSIAWVRYDANCRDMYVCFRESREVYVYLGVDPVTYRRFLKAESRGAFLNREIKGHYNTTKLG